MILETEPPWPFSRHLGINAFAFPGVFFEEMLEDRRAFLPVKLVGVFRGQIMVQRVEHVLNSHLDTSARLVFLSPIQAEQRMNAA